MKSKILFVALFVLLFFGAKSAFAIPMGPGPKLPGAPAQPNPDGLPQAPQQPNFPGQPQLPPYPGGFVVEPTPTVKPIVIPTPTNQPTPVPSSDSTTSSGTGGGGEGGGTSSDGGGSGAGGGEVMGLSATDGEDTLKIISFIAGTLLMLAGLKLRRAGAFSS